METYGEDPYLTGTFAVEFIRGLQGDDPKYLKTIATAKHYAVHSAVPVWVRPHDTTPGGCRAAFGRRSLIAMLRSTEAAPQRSLGADRTPR
jgi:hypothetical protein